MTFLKKIRKFFMKEVDEHEKENRDFENSMIINGTDKPFQ